jgi:hypothetical protein
VLAALGEELDSVQIITADAAARQNYPVLDPGQHVLLLGVADSAVAARLGALFAMAYPIDWNVTIVEGQRQYTLPLSDLASAVSPVRSLSVFIPPLPAASSFQALQSDRPSARRWLPLGPGADVGKAQHTARGDL